MTQSQFVNDVHDLLRYLSGSNAPAPICDAVDNLLKHAEKLARDNAKLLAACEWAAFLFAHGVGAMSGDKSNSERNIKAAIAIKTKLALAIAPAKAEKFDD